MTTIRDKADAQLADVIAQGFLLNDPRFERIKAWNILFSLLDASIRCFRLAEMFQGASGLEPMDDFTASNAMFSQGIVSYGRCFTGAAPGRKQLHPKDVFKENPALIPVHEEMMQIRHTFVAHSSDSGLDAATIATRESDDTILIRHLYTVELPFNRVPAFQEVVEWCRDDVAIGVNKDLNRLGKDLGKMIVLG